MNKSRLDPFKTQWDLLYDKLTKFNNGHLIDPTTLSSDLRNFYSNKYELGYTESQVSGVTGVTVSTITDKTNTIPPTATIIENFNTLYKKAISNYKDFRGNVNTYLDTVKTAKWFVKLKDNGGISTYTANTTFDAIYTAIQNDTYKITDTDLACTNVPVPADYNYNIFLELNDNTVNYTKRSGCNKVNPSVLSDYGVLSTAFDDKLEIFKDRYAKLVAFENAINANDYFKSRRITLKSAEALNVGDIVSAKNDMTVTLQPTLVSFYTNWTTYLWGGGGGGGGTLIEPSLLRYSWWINSDIFGAVYSGGGGGSGHMKRSATFDKFGSYYNYIW